MTWKYGGYENAAPSIPLYEFGEQFDFRMTYENAGSASFANAYLYVAPRHMGMLWAKLASEPESAYREVKSCLDANAFIGNVPGGGSIDIDFRLKNDIVDGNINLYIQVYLAHDDGATLPIAGFSRSYQELWKTCYDRVIFWRTDYTEAVNDQNVCTPRESPSEGYSDSILEQFEPSTSPGQWA